jgi:hypothetical protein
MGSWATASGGRRSNTSSHRAVLRGERGNGSEISPQFAGGRRDETVRRQRGMRRGREGEAMGQVERKCPRLYSPGFNSALKHRVVDENAFHVLVSLLNGFTSVSSFRFSTMT